MWSLAAVAGPLPERVATAVRTVLRGPTAVVAMAVAALLLPARAVAVAGSAGVAALEVGVRGAPAPLHAG